MGPGGLLIKAHGNLREFLQCFEPKELTGEIANGRFSSLKLKTLYHAENKTKFSNQN
jgi:hypothetical protein